MSEQLTVKSDFKTNEFDVVPTDVPGWVGDMLTWSQNKWPEPTMETLSYGESPEQAIDIWRPTDGRDRGCIVSVHGGSFSAEIGRFVNEPIARFLASQGFVVVNVEYRRIGSNGTWQTTTQDVEDAIAMAANRRDLGNGRVGLVAHSAGGYLALWAASHPAVHTAVALGPVLDLQMMLDDKNEPLDAAWLGLSEGGPESILEAADLGHRLPLGATTALFHGDADVTVPLAHSTDYAARAQSAGDDVEMHVLPGIAHHSIIDPRSEGCQVSLRRLIELMDRPF